MEVACRAVRLMSRADVWMTFTPGTERRVSAMFWAGWASSVSLVTTLIVAGASMSLPATFDALSTVTSSLARMGCPSFGGSAAAFADSWARSGPAASRTTPIHASHSRFINPPRY